MRITIKHSTDLPVSIGDILPVTVGFVLVVDSIEGVFKKKDHTKTIVTCTGKMDLLPK